MTEYKRILDSVHGNILIAKKYFTIIDTPYFQRLRRIEQSPIRSIFPCARHDRFIHSIGVFYIGQLIVEHLLQDAKMELYYGITEDQFNSIADTYILACLLHDIGHAPFSHLFEEYYNTMTIQNGEEIPTLLLKMKNLHIQSLNVDLPTKVQHPHEYCSALVAYDKIRPLLKEECWNNIDWELVIRMIIGVQYSEKENTQRQICNCFIRLLNGGVVDADRLDYTSRDVWASGYSTSMIDIPRLISSLHIKQNKSLSPCQYVECFNGNVVNEIESIVKVKDFQIQNVINHHTVIYENYLLQSSAERSINTYDTRGLTSQEKLEHLLSINSLENGVSLNGLDMQYICDDDIVFMMKHSNSSECQEWISRQYAYIPLWKSPDQFYAYYKDVPQNKTINRDKLEEILLAHLTKLGFDKKDILILPTKYKAPASLDALMLIVPDNDDIISYKDLRAHRWGKKEERMCDTTFNYVFLRKEKCIANRGDFSSFRKDIMLDMCNDMISAFSLGNTRKKWNLQYGEEGHPWEEMWFEPLDIKSTAWVIRNFKMPPFHECKFWVGYGRFGGLSEVADMYSIPIYKDINKNTQIDGAPPITPNAIGTLRIYDDSTDKNWYIGFIPDPKV